MSIVHEISKGESRRLEFKQQLPNGSSLIKTLVAFSNGAGGTIVIGVKDTGEILGITDDDVIELPDKISNIIHDASYPAIIPEIYSENIKGKNILIIEIYPGNLKPYYLKSEGKTKGTYVRVGATNKLADQEMIIELERQRRNVSFDEECLYDFDLKQLDFSKLKEDFKKLTGKELDDKGLINLKLIKEENGQKHPTKAVVMLLGNGYYEFARIKCARFKGLDVGEFIDQKEFNGPLYEQVENVMNFAKVYLSKKGKITELQRQDDYEVPLVAIREAVANAVVHRDYSISGSDIKFAIFDDRIEITSPGLLPKTVDINDIKNGRSEIRNKVIARFFKELRFIEEWGTGIRRIVSTCKEEGLDEPEFIETGMHFKVIIRRMSSDKVAISSDKVAISSDKIKLTDSEKKVIEYLKTNKTINNSVAKEIIKLSVSGIRKVFVSLVGKKLIKPVGENKNRHYVLFD